MDRKSTNLIALVIILACLIFITVISVGFALIKHAGGGNFASGGNKVALIRIEGVITGGRGSSGIGGGGSAGSEKIVDILEKFRKDDAVKALVIRINSPGGSAAGSQEIFQEVNKCRKEGKKVVISMGDIAASGGYYISCAGDRIYANSSTLTGSIGVILQTSDISALLNKYGINFNTIKSGKNKDIGSFSRPMTSEERALLQGLINDVFDQFVTDVSNGRHIPKEQVLKIADGSIFTGRQAKALHLVDENGTLQDALRAAADSVGIKGDFKTVEYEKNPGLLSVLFGDTDTKIDFSPQSQNPLTALASHLLKINSRLETVQ